MCALYSAEPMHSDDLRCAGLSGGMFLNSEQQQVRRKLEEALHRIQNAGLHHRPLPAVRAVH